MSMEEADKDSVIWSSDDGKSNDLSTTDAEENYFSPDVVIVQFS